MIGLPPRLRAVRALVHASEISAPLAKELAAFEGECASLAEARNRAMHDKRLVRWSTKEVVRFQVTAKHQLVFEDVVETTDHLESLAARIQSKAQHFIATRNRIIAALSSAPDTQPKRLPYLLDVNSPI